MFVRTNCHKILRCDWVLMFGRQNIRWFIFTQCLQFVQICQHDSLDYVWFHLTHLAHIQMQHNTVHFFNNFILFKLSQRNVKDVTDGQFWYLWKSRGPRSVDVKPHTLQQGTKISSTWICTQMVLTIVNVDVISYSTSNFCWDWNLMPCSRNISKIFKLM